MKFLFVLFSVFVVLMAMGTTEASICSLPKDIGPCRMAEISFWFNSATNLCEQFIYGGCDGNANRFETVEDCQAACP